MNIDHLTDADLVRRARTGDSAAFGLLVSRYARTIRALAYRWTRDVHESEDLAQDAFCRALMNLESLREDDRFLPWLRSVTTNTCRMWLRARRDVPSLDAPEREALRASLRHPGDTPDILFEKHEQKRFVTSILARLPERIRRTAVLFYLHELSYPEISRRLDIPISTVKIRLYKARIRLKKEALHMLSESSGTTPELRDAVGHLCVHENGYGFMRTTPQSASSPEDIYVSHSQIERFRLAPGDVLKGFARPPRPTAEKYWALIRIDHVNGSTPPTPK